MYLKTQSKATRQRVYSFSTLSNKQTSKPDVNVQTLWEAMKAFLQGQITAYNVNKNKLKDQKRLTCLSLK